MAIDVTQLIDYSWFDIAKMAKMAIVSSALGGMELRTPTGSLIRRITTKEATDLYNTAQQMIALESSGENGGNILIGRGDPQ